jgi:hypothetical protein
MRKRVLIITLVLLCLLLGSFLYRALAGTCACARVNPRGLTVEQQYREWRDALRFVGGALAE